jgi:hypothetical protein
VVLDEVVEGFVHLEVLEEVCELEGEVVLSVRGAKGLRSWEG